MNEKIIRFSAHPWIVADKLINPEPAKLNIPDWYKKVPNPEEHNQLTIKACKPFLDSLTAGYILKNPIDQKINFNTPGPDGKINTWVELSQQITTIPRDLLNLLHVNQGQETHPLHQVGGMKCPYAKQNQAWSIYKLLNPWTIYVPKGYSVLYMQPINRSEDRFEILSGIVDGPTPFPTNFPCVFKKQGSWILKKGDPIASVFPFKTENWKMKIEERKSFGLLKEWFKMGSVLRRWYEKTIWNKKRWN